MTGRKIEKIMDLNEDFAEKYGNFTQQLDRFRADLSPFIHLPIPIVGLFGNIAIIMYFVKMYRYRVRRMSTYHFMIVLLAMVDLMVVLFNSLAAIVLKEIIGALGIDKIPIIVIVIQVGSTTASCWVLVMLSYERYRSIVHPFKNTLKKNICSWFRSCFGLHAL